MIANKMLFLFVLISRTLGKEANDRIACDGLIFHDVYFDKELLFSKLGRPYNLVMHKYAGLLFFSHTIQNGSHVDFGITACQVEKKLCSDIAVPGGYAVAYDAGNDDIYFGGHDGLYKYNFVTQDADFFAEKGKSIWGIFVKKNFYYIEYPSQKLYVYQDDNFVKVDEAAKIEVDQFFISKHNDIYFSNKTALFKVERANRKTLYLNDEIAVRQIVEDEYGDVLFLASDGVYLENKPYHSVKKIAHIDQAFGLTFDEKDRVIFSNNEAIYRLGTSKYSNLCYEAIKEAEAVQAEN